MDKQLEDVLSRIKLSVSTAGELAQQGIDSAGKMATDMWSVAKLRWKQSELQNEVHQLYLEVGRLVYKAHSNAFASTDQLEQMLAKLDQKIAAIEEFDIKIKSRKGERPCPNDICKSTVKDGDVYCRKCGTSLHFQTEESQS